MIVCFGLLFREFVFNSTLEIYIFHIYHFEVFILMWLSLCIPFVTCLCQRDAGWYQGSLPSKARELAMRPLNDEPKAVYKVGFTRENDSDIP
jgi:hypothetical protein